MLYCSLYYSLYYLHQYICYQHMYIDLIYYFFQHEHLYVVKQICFKLSTAISNAYISFFILLHYSSLPHLCASLSENFKKCVREKFMFWILHIYTRKSFRFLNTLTPSGKVFLDHSTFFLKLCSRCFIVFGQSELNKTWNWCDFFPFCPNTCGFFFFTLEIHMICQVYFKWLHFCVCCGS